MIKQNDGAKREAENSGTRTIPAQLKESPPLVHIRGMQEVSMSGGVMGTVIESNAALSPEHASVIRANQKKLRNMQVANLIPSWESGDMSLRLSDWAAYTEVKAGKTGYLIRAIQPYGNLINQLKYWKGTVRVLSGLCLFSGYAGVKHADSESTSLTDPKVIIERPVKELDISGRISLYEAEGIYRLQSLIGNYVKGMQDKHAVEVSRFGLTTAYRLYAAGAYNIGLLSSDQFRSWSDMVDRRAAVLGDAQQRVLSYAAGEEVKVTDKDSLGRIAKYIDDSVAHREKVSYSTAIEMLKKDPNQTLSRLWSSEVWWPMRDIPDIDVSDDWHYGEQNRIWKEIINASYVFTLLEACSDRQVAIEIENPEEKRVNESAWDTVLKLKMDRGKDAQFAGIYAQRPYVIPGSDDQNFYYLPYHVTEPVEQQLADWYGVENARLSEVSMPLAPSMLMRSVSRLRASAGSTLESTLGMLRGSKHKSTLPPEAYKLIKERGLLRREGRYEEADKILVQLKERYNIRIEDTKEGTVPYRDSQE